MAGSYSHVVDKDGKLLESQDLLGMLDTHSGDVYEFAEEAYGMIWYLANILSALSGSPEAWVEIARQNYKEGLELSPGTDGTLPEDDV
jgi:hypothetical protein